MATPAIMVGIDRCVDMLQEFIRHDVAKNGPQREWQVIFNCGTVVHLHPSIEEEFTGFDSEEGRRYEEEWPTYRYRGSHAGVLRQNRAVWEFQRQALDDPEAGRILRAAVLLLLKDDYLYPGAGTKRLATQASKDLWIVRWPQRDAMILSIVMKPSPQAEMDEEKAMGMAGDFRRFDYMFPRVRTIITPNVEQIPVPVPPDYTSSASQP
jgi:hypothetical protein